MTREQHQAILNFFGQTLGSARAPMDIEADAIIRAMFKRHPEAAYRVTLLAMELAARPVAPPAAPPLQRHWLAALFDRPEAGQKRAGIIP